MKKIKYNENIPPAERKELERLDKEIEQRHKARKIKKKFWDKVFKFFKGK